MNLKKVLFVFSVSALSLTACTNESIEYVKDPSQAKEISFAPMSMPTTRGAADTYQYAIDGTDFPYDLNLYVAAYQVLPTATNYFSGTKYIYNYANGESASSGYWGGETSRYWPLSPCYINFLAYANVTGTAAFDGTTPASAATITQTDNSSAQTDLMYAIGHGEVTQSGNTLTFPTKIDMVFKHAQAWVDFYVKANSSVETAITINRITLNGAKYSGTYTITHTNYNSNSSQSVAGAWTSPGSQNDVVVPGWSSTALTTSFAHVGNGLMIVPDENVETGDFISFTINYTYKDRNFNYTFTPANTNVDQGKHYVYEITFTLHEIIVEATTDDWVNKGQYIDFPTYAVGTNWNYGTISKKAATYQFSISGLTGDNPTVAATGSATAFDTGPTISNGVVSFSVSANETGEDRNYTIVVTDGGTGSSGKTSTITLTQSGS